MILLALAAIPCTAGQVYKCKGPKGEVTFTNIKCPDNAAVQWTGTYQPVADDPRQAVAAHQEALRIRGEQESRDADFVAAQSSDQRSRASDAASIATNDSRSKAARDARETGAASQASRDAEYRETRKRWGARMAGPAPDGYAQAPAAAAPVASIPKPAASQTCNPTGGGNVTCFGSDGTVANGHVNENGSGTMFNSNGAIQQIHSMPKRDGTCVPDVNGFCN